MNKLKVINYKRTKEKYLKIKQKKHTIHLKKCRKKVT